jgi:hypothetical protein
VVSTPNPIGVSLDSISVDYTVSMNSVEMATGSHDSVSIGSGNSTLKLETPMRNESIPPWWTSHIRSDERTMVRIDATVRSARLGRSTDLSRSREIETDIFDEADPSSSTATDEGDCAGSGGASAPAATGHGGSDETETETEATATTTATESGDDSTDTPDGGDGGGILPN